MRRNRWDSLRRGATVGDGDVARRGGKWDDGGGIYSPIRTRTTTVVCVDIETIIASIWSVGLVALTYPSPTPPYTHNGSASHDRWGDGKKDRLKLGFGDRD